ncbi:hypothetical protein CEXT_540601 [Caerostris extrusa]|uniref:Uncharacterized protein n=1 Tax=Caerostris extrusa TaxID=172846 RepID=A0AAV4N9G6_CAEEX|nr:hypothetical protein CEXT_540601 [Caerostris extrusa]
MTSSFSMPQISLGKLCEDDVRARDQKLRTVAVKEKRDNMWKVKMARLPLRARHVTFWMSAPDLSRDCH